MEQQGPPEPATRVLNFGMLQLEINEDHLESSRSFPRLMPPMAYIRSVKTAFQMFGAHALVIPDMRFVIRRSPLRISIGDDWIGHSLLREGRFTVESAGSAAHPFWQLWLTIPPDGVINTRQFCLAYFSSPEEAEQTKAAIEGFITLPEKPKIVAPKRTVMDIMERVTAMPGLFDEGTYEEIYEQAEEAVAKWAQTAPLEWLGFIIAYSQSDPDRFLCDPCQKPGAKCIDPDLPTRKYVNPDLLMLMRIWSCKAPDYFLHKLGEAMLAAADAPREFLIGSLGEVSDEKSLPWLKRLIEQDTALTDIEIDEIFTVLEISQQAEAKVLLALLYLRTPPEMADIRKSIDAILEHPKPE
ncbi:MAG: hypothetical protein JWQ02_482 [Capsulimonas sp.]|nr:hypothetical protein [Capsulimonas sp.]